VSDPRVADGRRWGVLWVHHEAEALRVHDRATIREMTARHVVVDLLASGQVARMKTGRLVTRPPGSRPMLLWGTVCQDGESAALAHFLNDRCLLLPPSRLVPARPSHALSATSSGGFGPGKTRGGPMRPRRRQ
jgi:hypothetical protein